MKKFQTVAIITGIIIIIIIISSMFFLSNSTKKKLKQNGQYWAPSIEELKNFGISVHEKPIVEAKSSFTAGEFIMIYYGDPSPFFITIYPHNLLLLPRKILLTKKQYFLKRSILS